MDDVALARAVHLLSVLHWFGGVAFVTTVVLPAVARLAEPAVFVVEPLVLHDWFARRALADPDGTFALACRLHWILLAFGTVKAAAGALTVSWDEQGAMPCARSCQPASVQRYSPPADPATGSRRPAVVDEGQDFRVLRRLLEESRGARVERALAQPRRGLRGHQHHRQGEPAPADRLEQLEAAHSGKVEIGDQEIAVRHDGRPQELLGRGEGARRQSFAAQEEAQGVADRAVVVDDEDHPAIWLRQRQAAMAWHDGFDVNQS